MSFHDPSVWFLFLAVLTPLVWWRWVFARRRPAVRFSSVGLFRGVGSTWAVRARWVLPILRTIAVLVLIVCIARPQMADKRTEIRRDGIAIELIVDRSGSMAAMDLSEKQPVTRLDVARQVVERFVLGDPADDDDLGRPDDLIGLVVFGTFADSVCPMTLDHEHLATAIRQTDVAYRQEEAQTAIGDAIGLGVERLRSWSDRDSKGSGRANGIASRVIILLTDGENNEGDLDPITAAKMAQAFGIRIYAIGVGSNRRNMPTLFRDENGRRVRGTVGPVDEQTLSEIADITGGRYFRATDADSLRQIYDLIDELEKTEIEEQRFTEYYEPAVESVAWAGRAWPPLLLIVLFVLAIEVVLSCTRLRPLPG